MRQDQALIEIKEKFKDIVDIYKKNYDVNDYKIITKANKDELYIIDVIKKGHKNESSPFVIRYKKKGKEIIIRSEKKKGVVALVSFIKLVGVDDVFALGIKAKRRGLLIREGIDEKDMKDYVQIGNKYVYKKTENDEKVRQIEEIIRRLNIMDIASVEVENGVH